MADKPPACPRSPRSAADSASPAAIVSALAGPLAFDEASQGQGVGGQFARAPFLGRELRFQWADVIALVARLGQRDHQGQHASASRFGIAPQPG